MIELGKMQSLEIKRKTKLGAYLNSGAESDAEDILLPLNQMPPELEVGDELEVFVYKDSEDRMIATTKKSKITIGEFAQLRVVEISRIGAFLDWGLEKDLLLPFREQTYEIEKNGEYLVGLYIDKSNRLCASMDIYKLLSNKAPYVEKETVKGTIYKIHDELGAFVAVYNKYNGLIPQKEFYGDYKCGDTVEARIKKVREDGKLELSVRKEAHFEIKDDAQKIMDKLQSNDGKLQLNDDSKPEDIKRLLNMSKNAFKRAVGRLFKERKIKITEDGIEKL